MIVTIKHSKIPKVKHSEMLSMAGTVTNTAYQILTSMGLEGTEIASQALYVFTVISNTGSGVLDKWEKNQEQDEE